MSAVIQFFIAAGIIGVLVTWAIDWLDDIRIRQKFIQMLVHEILVSRYAVEANAKAMDRILGGDLDHTWRGVYPYEAWEIVKHSSKAHLLSWEDTNFFIQQYVQIQKFDEGYRAWHKQTPQDKKANLGNLKANKERLERYLDRLSKSPYWVARMKEVDAAHDSLLEDALRDNGYTEEQISTTLWGFRNDRNKRRNQ